MTSPRRGKSNAGAEYVWRCAVCRHGGNLDAAAGAVAFGPLAACGTELDRHDDVVEWGVYDDSIQCRLHPSGEIQHKVDGLWCRWSSCGACNGTGKKYPYAGFGRSLSYPRNAFGLRCETCDGSRGKYVPIRGQVQTCA